MEAKLTIGRGSQARVFENSNKRFVKAKILGVPVSHVPRENIGDKAALKNLLGYVPQICQRGKCSPEIYLRHILA